MNSNISYPRMKSLLSIN